MKKKSKIPEDSLITDQLKADLNKIMTIPEGRRFLWYALGLGGVYTSSFTGNSETFYLEGRRSVSLNLIADLNEADPRHYIKLLQENQND